MKNNEIKKAADGWYMVKDNGNFIAGFGDENEVALCGLVFKSKFQLKKNLKRMLTINYH